MAWGEVPAWTEEARDVCLPSPPPPPRPLPPLGPDAARRACAFLLGKQRADGGWGESYLSCQDKRYAQLDPGAASHVVNTAWALLSLIRVGYQGVDRQPLDAAARFLVAAQTPAGDWPQQHISGVFNRNCMITYANYRNIFPIWALGEYRSHVLRASK